MNYLSGNIPCNHDQTTIDRTGAERCTHCRWIVQWWKIKQINGQYMTAGILLKNKRPEPWLATMRIKDGLLPSSVPDARLINRILEQARAK